MKTLDQLASLNGKPRIAKSVSLPFLKKGSKGGNVVTLQNLLRSSGFYNGRVDGDFGDQTEGAVEEFQSAHLGPDKIPLEVDGRVGAGTWWALMNPSGSLQDTGLEPSGSTKGLSKERQAVIRWALGELKKGVREVPDGSNWGPRVGEYLKSIGFGATYWCAAFIQAGLIETKVLGGKPYIGKVALVWGLWNAARAKGQGFKPSERKPVPGDLFVQLHKNGTGHIGWVYKVSKDGKWVNTIEGNSSNRVKLLKRSVSSIQGWIVPYGDEKMDYTFDLGLVDSIDGATQADR